MAATSTANLNVHSTVNNHNKRLGVVEWFQFGDYRHVERALSQLRALGVTELRTNISWADAHRPHGMEWIRWLLQHLAADVSVLPCFLYTPPARGITPKTSSPPRDLDEYGAWVGLIIDELGDCFEWVELWNEPNNLTAWDWIYDHGWQMFARMVSSAAQQARAKGKKVALGGMSPIDPEWLRMMGEHGLLAHVDAVGIHGFPGTWESEWAGWEDHIESVKGVLEDFGAVAEVWISEAGYSTWRHDDAQQIDAFLTTIDAPASRIYWYSLSDLNPEQTSPDGFHVDERYYHFGLIDAEGNPKLLYRLWAVGGPTAVREVAADARSVHIARDIERPIVVTGGAGFSGLNLVHHLLGQGETVLVYDALTRPGAEKNLRWLRRQHGDRLQVSLADVRDRYALAAAVRNAKQVYHLAAQVDEAKSIDQPAYDFEVNVRGTLNLLEAIRGRQNPPALLFTSTSQVYGSLSNIELQENGQRYEPSCAEWRTYGIDESQPLEFLNPHACSKGMADQYVLDYARNYGIAAVVLRVGFIYGPHQSELEDQSWVASVLRALLEGQPTTIYGDGKQVRDILHVTDLVAAMQCAMERITELSGIAFNIGGGPRNSVSLLELLDIVAEIVGKRPPVRYEDWRTRYARYYVSDVRRFQDMTGWHPTVDVRTGVEQVYSLFRKARGFLLHSVPELERVP